MRPVLCLITDRRRHGASWRLTLPRQVAAAARAGVSLVQVRERDLDGAALLALVADCLSAVRGTSTRVLVNDRVDVALAAGAHGVHLRGDSVPGRRVRDITGRGFLIGRSVRGVDDARCAADDGTIDYLVMGTVFPSGSKAGVLPAGPEGLARVAAAVPVPVLAVGGVSVDRLPVVARAGAAGAAAIGLFADCPADQLKELVDRAVSLFDSAGTVP
jgi:thiamine-phosphate pyrophosphorylase